MQKKSYYTNKIISFDMIVQRPFSLSNEGQFEMARQGKSHFISIY